MTVTWFRYDAENNLIVTLHIQPGTKNTEAIGLHGDALKIKLAALPTDGKANAALLKFLALRFEVPITCVILKQGGKSRRKVVLIRQSEMSPEILFKA